MKKNIRPLTSLPRNFIRSALYPLLVGSSLVAFSLALHFNVSLEVTLLAISVVMLVTIAALERWLPFQKTWQSSQGDGLTDSSSALVLIGLIDPALKAALPVLAIFLLSTLPAASSSVFSYNFALAWKAIGFWPSVLTALLLSELAKYWAHRLHHQARPLWWLHAMHHSSRRLYWLNGFRFHPLNYAINTTLSVLPLWLIGAPEEVMLGVQAIAQPIILLQHANIDLRSGWLNQVFSTNEVHRCHHSRKADIANTNYGNVLLVWDQVFGTYRSATASGDLVEVGLFEGSNSYPATLSYWQQLQSMFTPACCRGAV